MTAKCCPEKSLGLLFEWCIRGVEKPYKYGIFKRSECLQNKMVITGQFRPTESPGKTMVIVTSYILRIEDGYVCTKNSTYQLGSMNYNFYRWLLSRDRQLAEQYLRGAMARIVV